MMRFLRSHFFVLLSLLLVGAPAYAGSPVTVQDINNLNYTLAVNSDGSVNVVCTSGCTGGGGGGNVNLTGINGVTPLAGAGATGTGSLRTTQAQDTTTVAGAAPTTTGIYVTGASAAALATAANQTTANTSLATIATNSGSSIPAGTALIGKVGIDQTTDGTTNAVHLVAGTAIAGKVGIDQTTDGTTNAVHLVAGTAVAGKVGIDQTTPGTTNAVQLIPGTSGGLTWTTFEPAASDNHTNLKNGAGQVYEITAFNNSATINYLRLYNAASGFNGCNSATNLVAVFHIPANTSDAGYIYKSDVGIPFSTGISYCVVSAYGQATTTNATASAIDINIGSK